MNKKVFFTLVYDIGFFILALVLQRVAILGQEKIVVALLVFLLFFAIYSFLSI